MRALRASEILDLWETSGRHHGVDLALILLQTASPELSWERLVRLTVGQRDERLMRLRELTFGSLLRLQTPCPQCSEALELELESPRLRVGSASSAGPHESQWEGWRLQWRLPDSEDLAALARLGGQAIGDGEGVSSGEGLLLQRCLLALWDEEGRQRVAGELPAAGRAALGEAMSAADPQAEVIFDLRCPRCEHRWQSLLDIVEIFTQELATQSRRLLAEVHFLARYYGWREADILALSGRRRQAYLDLARA
ncbi:MAG: phage baseplate protein [Acidobacteriota bacterium]